MSDQIIDDALGRISTTITNPRDEFKLGVALQTLYTLFYEYTSHERSGGRDSRIDTVATTDPAILNRLSTIEDVDGLLAWAKERAPEKVEQALALSGSLMGLQNGECRFIMYPNCGQICFEGNQTIGNTLLGRTAAAAVESGRADLLPLAKTRAAVAVIGSGAPLEGGNRPQNDHLHTKGRYFVMGDLAGQLHPLTSEQAARFAESGVIGGNNLPISAQGEAHAR